MKKEHEELEREDEPKDLHALNYARRILDFELGWPANTSNLNLVADCITAIAAKYRRSPYKAYQWLIAKIKQNQEHGIVIDGFWFREGKYTLRIEQTEKFAKVSRISDEEYAAVQQDRARFFRSPEYKSFLAKMAQKGM